MRGHAASLAKRYSTQKAARNRMASIFNDLLVLADAGRFNVIAISFRLSFIFGCDDVSSVDDDKNRK